MSQTAFALLLALVATLAIPLLLVVFPRLVSIDRLDQEGHRYGVDIQFFKIGAGVGVVMALGSAFKQGDTQAGILLIAAALGLAIALFIGLVGHLIWLRHPARRYSARPR